jgi:hypothetical protein
MNTNPEDPRLAAALDLLRQASRLLEQIASNPDTRGDDPKCW